MSKLTKKQKGRVAQIVRGIVLAIGASLVANPDLFPRAAFVGSLVVGIGGVIPVGEPNKEE